MFVRIGGWAKANMPTRETFERSRWLAPVAHLILRPELWRFHRRSVPRGVALGMLVGVLIPIAQTIFAALFALPARANVPVAALTTFITNPLTTPPIWAFAWWLGRKVLAADAAATGGALAQGLDRPDIGWFQWLLHDVGPALGLGLVIVAAVGAGIGYLLAAFGWRWWIGHKWRARGRMRSARAA